MNQKKLFEFTDKIKFERITINKYRIVNNGNKDYNFIMPFFNDKNWKINSYANKKIDIGNTLSAINIKGGQELYLSYIDYFRLFSKIIMLFSFHVLF